MVRLYVDGKYIADATVEGGRWLVEAGNVLIKPTQRIRIDMLVPGTADVAARAEVDFQVQLPDQTPTAVAAADPVKPLVTSPPEPSAPVAVTTPPATTTPAAPPVATSAPPLLRR